MNKKKKTKNIETIRVSGASLDAFRSELLRELIRQSVYNNNKTNTTYFSLEEITGNQTPAKTLCNIEGIIVDSDDILPRKRMVFSPSKKRAILSASSLDFQIAYDLSPIPTGTEKGIVNVQVARNKSGKLILLFKNKQFALK